MILNSKMKPPPEHYRNRRTCLLGEQKRSQNLSKTLYMSAATLLRINRLTLQTSRRWFASSSQLLTARSNGNGPDSPTPPATDDGATEQDTSIAASTSQESAIEYTEMSMGDGSPEKSSTDSTSVAPTNVTKGRKVIRKARRSLPSVSST